MKKLVLLAVVALVAATASVAMAGKPNPFSAAASSPPTGVGSCPGTATTTWSLKGQKVVRRIEYTWSYGGGIFQNYGGAKSGTDVQSVSVPNGATWTFTANFYSDFNGTILLGTVTSNPATCNA